MVLLEDLKIGTADKQQGKFHAMRYCRYKPAYEAKDERKEELLQKDAREKFATSRCVSAVKKAAMF